jgi:hypothetical protein
MEALVALRLSPMQDTRACFSSSQDSRPWAADMQHGVKDSTLIGAMICAVICAMANGSAHTPMHPHTDGTPRPPSQTRLQPPQVVLMSPVWGNTPPSPHPPTPLASAPVGR